MKYVFILFSLALSFSYAQDCDEGFRPFEHAAGTTCIPQNPERIVTTQDQNALLPLLELGVRPVGSAGLVGNNGETSFRRVEGYDTEGIAFVGSYGEPNLEAVAAQQPDLIIGSPFQENIYDQLSAIAPTVLIDVHDRPLEEGLMDFADVVGREARLQGLEAAYRASVEDLLNELGERRETLSVSVITAGENPGEFYRADQGQAVGTVMNDLDLLRPEAQQDQLENREYLGVESLPEHDADAVLVFDFSGEGQDPNVDAFMTSPLFETLNAAQAEQVYRIDGTETVGAAWSKMEAYLDELERILLGSDLDMDVVQE